MTDPVLAELRALSAKVDRLVDASAQPKAVKRTVAARLLGIGVTKLDALVRDGKLATAEDVRLIPMREIERYCAPRPKRQRAPSVGVRASRRQAVDTQSDEAIEEYRRSLRKAAR